MSNFDPVLRYNASKIQRAFQVEGKSRLFRSEIMALAHMTRQEFEKTVEKMMQDGMIKIDFLVKNNDPEIMVLPPFRTEWELENEKSN